MGVWVKKQGAWEKNSHFAKNSVFFGVKRGPNYSYILAGVPPVTALPDTALTLPMPRGLS